MQELFDLPAAASAPAASASTETAAEPPVCGRILIVDDDPVVAGMLGVTLSAAGHAISEVYSGEEAIAHLATAQDDALPDIVILDIEMPGGLDGYDTCRQLRANPRSSDLPVIFLSGHDELEDRLRAYDAGGSDFMAKPFVPGEVLHKAALSIRHKRRQETSALTNRSSFDTAMTALTSLGESGVTLKFSRDALGCHTLRALAGQIIESVASLGIACHVQLRAPSETLTLTPSGPASPLEESVIEKSRLMDRIFSFRSRLIVNYGTVSLMVTNMPTEDPDRCGRIRDHVAMIADAAELAVDNIGLRTEVIARSKQLRELSNSARMAVDQLRGSYRTQQMETRTQLEVMTNAIEGMYVNLGLTDSQEETISETVREAVERVLALYEQARDFDLLFAGIIEDLTQASETTVKQEDEAPQSIELW